MKNFISDEALDRLIKANADCSLTTEPQDLAGMHPQEAMHLHRMAVMGGSAVEHQIVQGFIDTHLATKAQKSDTSTNG